VPFFKGGSGGVAFFMGGDQVVWPFSKEGSGGVGFFKGAAELMACSLKNLVP